MDARRVGGLLIVIPDPNNSSELQLDKQTLENWNVLEKWIISREIKVPIYFTIESEEAGSIVEFLKQSSG